MIAVFLAAEWHAAALSAELWPPAKDFTVKLLFYKVT